MIKPTVPKSFVDNMKLIRDDITLVWNDIVERFQVVHKDKRTGLRRIVLQIEEEDGTYRPPDTRSLLYLQHTVAWECLDAYPNPVDLFKVMSKTGQRYKDRKAKKIAQRKEYLKWWNKEHKKEWRVALENARKGFFKVPKDPKRKLIIDGGKNAVR